MERGGGQAFLPPAAARPRGRARFRRPGRIVFRCNEARGRSRAAALIEWIEFEFVQVQKLRDRRVMIEIGDSYFRIER